MFGGPDVWHLMFFTRQSKSEGILDVVSEQIKHTGINFLCYEENIDQSICPRIRDARHQSFSASTQPSQTRHARSKRTFYGRKTDSYSPVSSKSARSHHYYLAKSATTISWNERSPDICIANQYPQAIERSRALSNKMNVVYYVRLWAMKW